MDSPGGDEAIQRRFDKKYAKDTAFRVVAGPKPKQTSLKAVMEELEKSEVDEAILRQTSIQQDTSGSRKRPLSPELEGAIHEVKIAKVANGEWHQ